MSLTVTPQNQAQSGFGDHRYAGFAVPYNAQFAPQQPWGYTGPPLGRGPEQHPTQHALHAQHAQHVQPQQVQPQVQVGGPAYGGSANGGPAYPPSAMPEHHLYAQQMIPAPPQFHPQQLFHAAPDPSPQTWVGADSTNAPVLLARPPEPPPAATPQADLNPGHDVGLVAQLPPDGNPSFAAPPSAFGPSDMSIDPSELLSVDPNRVRLVVIGIHGEVGARLQELAKADEKNNKRKAPVEPLDVPEEGTEDRTNSAPEAEPKLGKERDPESDSMNGPKDGQDDDPENDTENGEDGPKKKTKIDLAANPKSPFKMPNSICIVEGDTPTTGWSTDYYGLSEQQTRYGRGIGWETQEAEATALIQHPPAHTTMFVCKQCSLRWKGVSLEHRRLLREDNVEERKAHRIPPAARKGDPSFTRPGCREMHWYLDHDSGKQPCIRGHCDVCIPRGVHEDMEYTDGKGGLCCPPGLAKGLVKQVYKCIMDNCPFITSSLPEMRQHLMSAQKWPHKAIVTGIIERVRKGRFLSDLDLEICARLMFIFNDRDAAGKPIVSRSDCTKLDPDKISNPAVKREHVQWVDYLDPPESRPFHETIRWDPERGCFLQGLWIMGRDENYEPCVLPVEWLVLEPVWDPRWRQYFLWPVKPPPKKKRRKN